MDILHGVSASVGNAVRSVGATLPTPATASTTPTNAAELMSPQMNATLNQLLSMGFSNHDGWLARLVQAKKGDMDAVLTALFDRNE